MILLSFDTEEFDVPREHGVEFPLEAAMEVSIYGTLRILDCLLVNDVRATFFCTTNFAENAPEVMRRIVAEGHEVAAHGCDHWKPQASDVARSREVLRQLTGQPVEGYRQPRMFPVSDTDIRQAGYLYNSSLNPAFIPGRYMHLNMPRTCFVRDGVVQIPASVTPWLRFPLFWLSCHNLPQRLYRALARWTWRHDGYFNTYFHPWEFYPLGEHPEFKMPFIIRNHAGKGMEERLAALIQMFRVEGATFGTYSELARLQKEELSKNERQE
ncbi:MAG: polysaccharide deacetylase family protein [Mediterranea sp.]|jgi:peptidoglycan/xylan/chitin deacetylase (PgdA/CDA1 family)|nr:polysaccharide deacetylase family protein [Mediterranea sp.]